MATMPPRASDWPPDSLGPKRPLGLQILQGRLAGLTDPMAGLTDPMAGLTDPIAGLTDPIAGLTDPIAGFFPL